MPDSGHVVDLVTVDVGAEREAVVGAAQEVFWFGGSGPGRKRIRQHTLWYLWFNLVHDEFG